MYLSIIVKCLFLFDIITYAIGSASNVYRNGNECIGTKIFVLVYYIEQNEAIKNITSRCAI